MVLIMDEYHVNCGVFGIYAGTLKNKHEWKEKSECTEEAIEAVRNYMVDNCLGGLQCTKGNTGAYTWKLKDGRTVEMRISVKEKKE